jgi:hypothetical protein
LTTPLASRSTAGASVLHWATSMPVQAMSMPVHDRQRSPPDRRVGACPRSPLPGLSMPVHDRPRSPPAPGAVDACPRSPTIAPEGELRELEPRHAHSRERRHSSPVERSDSGEVPSAARRRGRANAVGELSKHDRSDSFDRAISTFRLRTTPPSRSLRSRATSPRLRREEELRPTRE